MTGYVKATSYQAGLSSTANNNVTFEVPATPDGSFKLGRGVAGALAATPAIEYDAAGVLSLRGPVLRLTSTGNVSVGNNLAVVGQSAAASFQVNAASSYGFAGTNYTLSEGGGINSGSYGGYFTGGAWYTMLANFQPGGFSHLMFAYHQPAVIAQWVFQVSTLSFAMNSNGFITTPAGTVLTSDERVKRNFRTEDWRDRTADLWVGSFERTDMPPSLAGPSRPRRYLGIKAQDAFRKNPEIIHMLGNDPDMPDKLGADYGQVAVMALGLAKQLAVELDELKAELAELKARG